MIFFFFFEIICCAASFPFETRRAYVHPLHTNPLLHCHARPAPTHTHATHHFTNKHLQHSARATSPSHTHTHTQHLHFTYAKSFTFVLLDSFRCRLKGQMKRVRGEIKKGEDILTTKQNEGKHKRLIKVVSFPNRTGTYSPGIRRDAHTHTLRPISLCRFYPVSFSSSLNLPPSALVCFFRPFFVPFLFFFCFSFV